MSGSDPNNNNSIPSNTNTFNRVIINTINNNSVRLPSITLDSNANTPTGSTPIDFSSRSQPVGISTTLNGKSVKLALPPLDKNSPGFPLSPPVFSASTTPAAQTGIPTSSQLAIGGSDHQEQQKQQQEPQKQQQEQQQQEQHREEGNDDTLQTYPVDQRKQESNQNNYTPSDTGDSFFDLLNVNNSRPGNILNTPVNNFAGLLSFNNNTGPQGILNSSLQNYTNNSHTQNGNVSNNAKMIASNDNNTLNPMLNNLNGTAIPNNVFSSTNNNNNIINNTNPNSNALNSFANTGSAYSETPRNIISNINNNNNNKASNISTNNNNAQNNQQGVNDNIILDSFLKSFQNGDLFNLFNNLQNNNFSNKNPLYPLPLSLDKNFSNEEQEVIIYKSSDVSTKPTSSGEIGVLLNAEIDLSFAASSALTLMVFLRDFYINSLMHISSESLSEFVCMFHEILLENFCHHPNETVSDAVIDTFKSNSDITLVMN
ncbi:unnamed protein product [[Candida] boidinii]|nr:unnamed protein product [[Candida] boidinii]